MTDTQLADRIKALQALATANLLQKAQRGESLSAADWKETRRLARDTGLFEAPWIHETLDALSAAIGVTTRTLENWRQKGCPCPTEGPHDELRIRLWHMAQQFDRALIGDLTPAKAPLDSYVALLLPLVEKHKTFIASSGDQLKRKQVQKLDVAIDGLHKRHIAEAKRHFTLLLRQMQKLLLRDLTSEALRLHALAQQPAAKAEPELKRHLEAVIARCVSELIGVTAKRPTTTLPAASPPPAPTPAA